MTTVNNYNLNNHKQLIDLNGDTINFDITFTVTSKENSEFELLVVDQATLDNNPSLEYKHVKGIISGNIISDKNVYQNYFLILKSENPCDVEVKIEKKEIEPNTSIVNEKIENLSNLSSKRKINWKIIIIICIILIGSAFLYYIYKRTDTIIIKNIPIAPSIPMTENSFQDSPKSFNFAGANSNDNLINRLNNLALD